MDSKEHGALNLAAINSADIRGRLTRIRPMLPDEAAIIHAWNNAAADVYAFWGQYDHRHLSLKEFLADTVGDAHFFDGSDVVKGRWFSIELLEEPHVGTVIGMINTNDIEIAHRSTEIDVAIGHPQYRERGYGTDASGSSYGFCSIWSACTGSG